MKFFRLCFLLSPRKAGAMSNTNTVETSTREVPGKRPGEPIEGKKEAPAKNMHNRELGMAGEEVAVAALRESEYVIVDRTWRCKAGEVDVVALSPDRVLAFVEVKTRSNHRHGRPSEAITMKKLGRMRRVMGAWLHEHQAVPTHRGIRLDLISVDWNGRGEPKVKHLRGLK